MVRWFRGTADALYQNINLIEQATPDYVVVFGADHIYRMNIREMIEYHVAKRATATVAAIPVERRYASEFGVIEANADGRIMGFHEKNPDAPSMPGDPTGMPWTTNPTTGGLSFSSRLIASTGTCPCLWTSKRFVIEAQTVRDVTSCSVSSVSGP